MSMPATPTTLPDVTEAAHPQLRALIRAYRDAESTAAPLTTRLESLHAILEQIYTWYNDRHVFGWHLLDPQEAAARLEIDAVESAAESLHQRLVGEAVAARVAPLVMPGVPSPIREAAEDVWADLLVAKPVIAVEGTPQLRARSLSRLARIAQTQAGMRLLNKLTRLQRPITLTEGIPERWRGYVAEPAKTVSMAHPQIAWSPHRSFISASDSDRKQWTVDLTQAKAVSAPPGDGTTFAQVTAPADILQAVLGLASGITVTTGDRVSHYAFSSGAYGSVVDVRPNEEDDLAGRDGRAVHTPEWLTLAHELGHALTQVRGAATFQRTELFAALLPGVADADTRWTNPEELVVIEGLENPIRREAGLAERGSHSPAIDPNLPQQMKQLKTALEALAPRVDATDGQRIYDQVVSRYADLQGKGQPDKLAWCRVTQQFTQELRQKYNIR